VPFTKDTKGSNYAIAALLDVPQAPARSGYIEVLASATTEDRMESLVDVLENLPPAKPTRSSLTVQLATPGLLAAKSIYDLVSALLDVVKDPSGVRAYILLALSVLFIAASVMAGAMLVQAYRDALAKTDPHHKRALDRARAQLATLRADARNAGTSPPAGTSR
jgi:hypothetical protein